MRAEPMNQPCNPSLYDAESLRLRGHLIESRSASGAVEHTRVPGDLTGLIHAHGAFSIGESVVAQPEPLGPARRALAQRESWVPVHRSAAATAVETAPLQKETGA
jgi:hypothetical protein